MPSVCGVWCAGVCVNVCVRVCVGVARLSLFRGRFSVAADCSAVVQWEVKVAPVVVCHVFEKRSPRSGERHADDANRYPMVKIALVVRWRGHRSQAERRR